MLYLSRGGVIWIRKINFTVNSDVYEKFCLALNLTNESEGTAIELVCVGILQRHLKKPPRSTTQRL